MSRLQKSIAMHLKPPMNDLSEKMLLDLVRSTGLAGGIKKRRRFFAELDDSPRHKALVRRVVGSTDPAIRQIQARSKTAQ
jgi:hypothetical protein